jgi:hypothetical protein
LLIRWNRDLQHRVFRQQQQLHHLEWAYREQWRQLTRRSPSPPRT